MSAGDSGHALVTKTLARYDWVPDKARKTCVGCSTIFTVKNRRHHCRFCGEIFCAKCLSRVGPGKGQLCCKPCRQKTEGKVVLTQSKKERKLKAKEAVAELRSKLAVQRSGGSSGKKGGARSVSDGAERGTGAGGETAKSRVVPATTADELSAVSVTAATARPSSDSAPTTAELAPVSESPKAHTAAFESLFVSPQTANINGSEDPFSMTGQPADFDDLDEDNGDDIDGLDADIGNMSTQGIGEQPEAESMPDFAAMLAMAEDMDGDNDGF